MDGYIEDGDFGRDRLGRADVGLAKETSFKFNRSNSQRLFLTLLKVWEWVPWKRSESFWSTFIIMMVSYHIRNSFSCTMKSIWALCCSKVNVRRSSEPICDLRIAKFSHASQFLRLVIEPTSSGLEAVGLTYKNFFSKLNIGIFSLLHLH